MRVTLTASMVLAVWVLSTPALSASVFEPVSDRQLVCESTDMIRGHVTGVQSAWDGQHRAIWTTATVAIEEVLRGSLNPTTSIQVKEVGGSVGDYTIKAEGFPTFRQDEEVVLLLQPWEDGSGAYHVWGYGRGMFVVSHRDNRAPTAARYDVVETGRATMLTDRLAPEAVLDQLSRELRGLARSCDAGASP